jgi:hypothetical protein
MKTNFIKAIKLLFFIVLIIGAAFICGTPHSFPDIGGTQNPPTRIVDNSAVVMDSVRSRTTIDDADPGAVIDIGGAQGAPRSFSPGHSVSIGGQQTAPRTYISQCDYEFDNNTLSL